MANHYKDGKKAYRAGYLTNPYTSTVNRDEWQRGFDDAQSEAEALQAVEAKRRDDLWNVPDEAKDEYIAMEDNFGPETVLRFTIALLAQHGGQS